MVKRDFFSNRRKIISSLLILCIGVVVYPLLKSGCNTNKTPWHLDAKYSEQLTIDAGMDGSAISKTVDAIRIYRNQQKHDDMYSLPELFEKDLLFESTDKKLIQRFVLAGQQIIMHIDCNRNKENEYYHVILLDNKQMRAGYYLFIRCEGEQYAIIRSLQKGGGSNIYYNSSLLQNFKRELHIIGKNPK